MPPPDTGLPEGFRVTLDPTAERPRSDVLVGGSPVRLVRLSPAGAASVDGWQRGKPVQTANERRLARRLTDAGLAHPQPPPEQPSAAGGKREVTVVIPVRDRPEGLRATLHGLGPTGPVIVVDDGSSEVDAAHQGEVARARKACVVRHEQTRGPAAARNEGARRATTEFVAFVDADCVPSSGWLDALLPHFQDPTVGAVAPRVRPTGANGTGANGTGANGWLNAYERAHSPLDLGGRPGPVRPRSWVPYVPTAALVIRRSAFEEAGGFDEALRFGEDVDLVWRLHRLGWRVRYEPAATAEHPTRPTATAWARQRFDYGRSAAALAVRHADAVAPLDISPWSVGPWVLLLGGHPRLALGAAAGTAAALPLRLKVRDRTTATALAGLAWKGNLAAGANLAKAVRRAWLPPLLLAATRSRIARRALVASFATNPLTVLDDLAYQAGVWAGVLQAKDRRAFSALLPGRGWRPADAAPA